MDKDEEARVRELLHEWGIKAGEVQDKFIAQDMDLFALEHMDDQAFSTLLPSEGLRIRFKIKRSAWVKTLKVAPVNDDSVKVASVNNNSVQAVVEPILPGSFSLDDPNIKLLRTDPNGNLIVDSLPDNFMEGDDDGEAGKENDRERIETPQSKASTPLQENSINRTPPSSETPLPKRIKTYDLKKVLNSQSAGKKILALYAKDNEFKKDSVRDELVECILDEETRDDLGKVVPRERLKVFAQAIIDQFPTENEATYFDHRWNPRTKKHEVKGKLVWRVYNRRRSFVNAGALPAKSKTPAQEKQKPTKLTLDQDTQGKLCWLQSNRGNKGNWDTVLSYWKDTSAVRMHDLLFSREELDESELNEDDENLGSKTGKKGKKPKLSQRKAELLIRHKAAQTFVNKYPAFQEDSGFQLFEIDFKTRQPDVNPLAFFNEWASLSLYVAEEIQKNQHDFLDDPTLTPGEKNLTILQNISKLFPIVTVSGDKKGKKTWRPSHAEAADAFVMFTPSVLQLEEDKLERRASLQKLGMKMQPFVAVVGEIEDAQQFIVCIDEFSYEVSSVLQAVDVVFKACFALNLSYAPEAEQIWLFIQRSVYCFTTEEDTHYSGVDTRVAEYSRFKSRKAGTAS